jgi:hypothetical protein
LSSESLIRGLESAGAVLDGLSLQDAYLLFLRMNFSNPDLLPTEGSGPMVLTSDACEALSRVDKRSGVIVRHPDLMVADDDWDEVARRLVNSNAIGIDEARDDILVYRHFWKLFEDGKWKMTGRATNVAAGEQVIEPRLFRYFCVFDLRRSSIEDGEWGGARFVDVRVHQGEQLSKLPLGAAPLDEPDQIEKTLTAVGIDSQMRRRVGRIILEREVSVSAPFDKEQQDNFRREFKERGFSEISHDSMRQHFAACCKKLFKDGLTAKD